MKVKINNSQRSNRVYIPILLFFSLALFIGSCSYPFITISNKWKIDWDIEKLDFKDKYLAQDLPEHTGIKPPNILYIVVDDLGKFEVSAYGSQTMKTPNIDKLASKGVMFTDCYVNASVCSPSRAGLLTGRYPQRYGFETQPMERYPNNLMSYYVGKNIINTGNFEMVTEPTYPAKKQMIKQGLPPTEMNLAEILKMRNYNTAIIGKWHLGFDTHLIPNNRGFDEQFGFYGASSIYTKTRKSEDIVSFIQPNFSANHQWKTGRKKTASIRRNDKIVKEDRYLTWAFMDEAIEFMDANSSKPEPFFLYLTFNAPHVPFQAPKEYYEMHADEKDENKRVYYAMINALDDAIGNLVEKMESLGLDENTIIYFISDNGGATYTGATDNGPYKGGKLTNFEGGVNVPCIISWKGHINEGEVYDKPISSFDLFATAVEAAECPLPNDRVYDGVNLLPYLTGEKEGEPHKAFYWRTDHIQAMREGDYKYILSTRDNWAELYKISEDKYEQYDLNIEQPEILMKMRKDFDKWQEGLQEPAWPRIMDIRFVIDGKKYLFPA